METEKRVAILRDTTDPPAAAAPVAWAAGQLGAALEARGIAVRHLERLEQAGAGERCILAAGRSAPSARDAMERAGVSLPDAPEALALAQRRIGNRSVLLACGSDSQGLMYALLELADRVTHGSDDPYSALEVRRPIIEQAANPVRSVARLFVSEVEDKPWFYDREFWRRYLSMLAAQRFNRFSLTFGIGYDFLGEVRDSYLHFAYPFLVDVPGYNVRASGLPDAERARNLETLRDIGQAAVERGLRFQLGLWTHGYDWPKNPGVNYRIEGLTPANHAAYCRDALRTLLQSCPQIGGVTFRIHGESGVPEGTYAFWKTVFDGVAQCGRRVEIDMHAKGIDREMIEVGLATGMPVNISPKYWAEHMGLPYHQAAIRALEMPPPGHHDEGFFARSGGSRSFLRYGYGDLLTEERRYGVLHRIWPGTQRFLLWGDPAFAAAYGRAAGFCGSVGMEWCEPLSFKGRKGSGLPGGRDAYADADLRPAGGDWEKYLYAYRLWGRCLYNPDTPPDPWRRFLRREYGAAAGACETALAQASRILPLLTTAHLPSAANYGFWPEVYTNMPIVDAGRPHPYGDTPSPKRFGTVSPLDPALFSTIEECARELLGAERSGKHSPLETAAWLEEMARKADHALAQAEEAMRSPAPAFRRLAEDVAIQCGLGRFFAAKLRAGVLYSLYEQAGDPAMLREALEAYRAARQAWAGMAQRARPVYRPDITYGPVAFLRGHWLDRLAAIDQDIADMEQRLAMTGSGTATRLQARKALREALASPRRDPVRCRHTPPLSFRRGEPVEVALLTRPPHPAQVMLHYRHVNQGETYQAVVMQAAEGRFASRISGAYTAFPYPLEYHFAVREASGRVWLYPGFQPDLTGQPYFVVRQER